MCHACGLALLALFASYCFCAMLACAACFAVCIRIRAVHVQLGASRPVCSIAFALYLLCIICFCSHLRMCDACGWALPALSASYCICAIPAYAFCSAVCISICAVHEPLGASRPVCSIAFALCLCVQHVPLLALAYVPRMRLGPSCLVRIILHLRYDCLCSLLCCLH